MSDLVRPRRRTRRSCLSAAAAAAVGAALLAPLPAAQAAASRENPVLAWDRYAGEASVAACISPFNDPLHESRMMAMTSLAVHDAVNAIRLRSTPYAFRTTAVPGASVAAAVAAAARGVLVPVIRALPAEFPAQCREAGVQVVQQRYTQAVRAVPDGAAQDAGVRLGRAAANAVLAQRVGDGSDTPLVVADHPQGDEPGEWRFTPDRPFAFGPGWGSVRPFALRDGDQFPPEPAYAVGSRAYARDLADVQRLGGNGTTTATARTAEQTEIAHFWWESSPLMWNRIARTVAASHDLDAWQAARLLGQLNAALADGYVGAFAHKYAHPFWRPVTAIRLAGSDGNPATRPDRDWTPLEVTPPIPDHASAHAVEGGAAAAVLTRFFGRPDVPFAVCSTTLPPEDACGSSTQVRRHFPGFRAAARENAVSRVYIGFHFRHASDAGRRQGLEIGAWTAERLLQPVR